MATQPLDMPDIDEMINMNIQQLSFVYNNFFKHLEKKFPIINFNVFYSFIVLTKKEKKQDEKIIQLSKVLLFNYEEIRNSIDRVSFNSFYGDGGDALRRKNLGLDELLKEMINNKDDDLRKVLEYYQQNKERNHESLGDSIKGGIMNDFDYIFIRYRYENGCSIKKESDFFNFLSEINQYIHPEYSKNKNEN